MKVSVEKLQILFLASITIVIVWYLSVNQIVVQNEYMGMSALTFSLSSCLALLYFPMFIIVFLYTDIHAPEGILVGVLLFYCFVWFLFFYSVSGFVSVELVLLGGSVFLLPMVIFALSGRFIKVDYKLRAFQNGLFKIRIEFVITIVLFIISALVYKIMGVSSSFVDSYERRIIAREEVVGLVAYFFSMSLNGFAPLLAFLSIYNKKYIYLFVAIFFSLLGFGFIGTKAPIGYVVLMALIGYCLSKGGEKVVLMLVLAMTALVFLAFLEYLFFGISSIADIYIRRAMLLVPQNQMYFLDYIFNAQNSTDLLLSGVKGDRPISFIVGDVYYSMPESNANTISFLTELGRHGFFGYLANIVFLAFFYSMLSHLYRSSRHGVWLALSTLYALLLLEQSYSTAFVSSGIGLSFLMLLLFAYQRKFRL